MDGNFALAPKLFSQLYVIRVEINKNFTTAVYILLQNKTLATYEIDAYYTYKGKKYHGELLSKDGMKRDSAWIKILPENPSYLAWCREDSIGLK